MAWGYSASSRGRKAKGEKDEDQPSREGLQALLIELFGAMPSPVPSLFKKLAGGTDITVKDAARILAALFYSWPDAIDVRNNQSAARKFAELFLRELLAELSAGQSLEWTNQALEERSFSLVDEERIGISQFIKEAGEQEGALIVSGRKKILIGESSVDIIKQFHEVTNLFVGRNQKSFLVFVFNSSFFEAGKESFSLISNMGLLITAVMSFAILPPGYDYELPIQQHGVDWRPWRELSQRCCVVLRKPPLIEPGSGDFLPLREFDKFISHLLGIEFEQLPELKGYFRFEGGHVLPRRFPSGLDDNLVGRDLYWDVLVRPTSESILPEVQYYVPGEVISDIDLPSSRGRRTIKVRPVEEAPYYLIRKRSPGADYDDAQRTIFLASRARLKMDEGEDHLRNLNAAAALRQVGYEVLPISLLLLLFPKILQLSAAAID